MLARTQNNVVIQCCASFLVHRDRVTRNPRALYQLLFNLSYAEACAKH